MSRPRPITLTLAALGGQGGGVVCNWLVDVARRERYVVQATSVPGVAQRTGATIYYLEFFPEASLPADGRRPIMALMPSPGDVDIVIASELVEAGRVIQRGLVTPDRTTLIASTHRAYTISERSNPGDGRASSERILGEARQQAKRFVALDMAQLAEQHGAVISAVILGAIAGAAGLPFQRESYRMAIRAGGIAVERNLVAFDAGAVLSSDNAADKTTSGVASAAAGASVEADLSSLPSQIGARIAAELPRDVQSTAIHGAARLIDYQDERYALQYLTTLQPFVAIDAARATDTSLLTRAVARYLALWMSFEDTIRVADLKTRTDRERRIRAAAKAKPGQLIQITEFMKPRIEEICGTLPASLGRRLLASKTAARWLRSLTDGREIRSSTISGYALLRFIGGLRRWRRGTLRFQTEAGRITQWLQQLQTLAASNYELAVELAECQKLVRGYGDTYERGLRNFDTICAQAPQLVGRSDAATRLAELRKLAGADDSGVKLAAFLNA